MTLAALVAALFLAALVAVFLLAKDVRAQGFCAPRDEIVGRLDRDYQESLVGFGIAGNGAFVEMYASEGGSWSMLITRTDGMTCVAATGRSWEIVEPAAESEEES